MVFDVRCFKCGEHQARLVLGGRSIIHARCHACGANLLAEVMALEKEAMESLASPTEDVVSSEDAPPTQSIPLADLDGEEEEALPQA